MSGAHATRAHELTRLGALLYAVTRELSDLNDPRALQRAGWLADLAVEIVDDLTLHAEQSEQVAGSAAGGKADA